MSFLNHALKVLLISIVLLTVLNNKSFSILSWVLCSSTMDQFKNTKCPTEIVENSIYLRLLYIVAFLKQFLLKWFLTNFLNLKQIFENLNFCRFSLTTSSLYRIKLMGFGVWQNFLYLHLFENVLILISIYQVFIKTIEVVQRLVIYCIKK